MGIENKPSKLKFLYDCQRIFLLVAVVECATIILFYWILLLNENVGRVIICAGEFCTCIIKPQE